MGALLATTLVPPNSFFLGATVFGAATGAFLPNNFFFGAAVFFGATFETTFFKGAFFAKGDFFATAGLLIARVAYRGAVKADAEATRHVIVATVIDFILLHR